MARVFSEMLHSIDKVQLVGEIITTIGALFVLAFMAAITYVIMAYTGDDFGDRRN